MALIVAADVYAHKDLPPVKYARNDARDIQQTLIQTMGVPKERITLLEGPQATLTAVKIWLELDLPQLVGDLPAEIFVFVSGHGLPALRNKKSHDVESFLLFYDARPDAPSVSGLSISTLIEKIEAAHPQLGLVMIDACFSGGYHEGTLLKNVSGVGIRPTQVTVPDQIHVLSATDVGQMATWHDAQGHGLFTYALLQGLSGKADANGNRQLTLGELNNYLQQSVPPLARELGGRIQVPQTRTRAPQTMLIEYNRK